MSASPFIRREVNGIRVHVLPTERFKTHSVSLYAGAPLLEETVTANAVIPFVLRRGSADYPETRAFRARLDELYGASFGFDVYKRGNNQIIQFRLDAVADRYVPAGAEGGMLREALRFLIGTVCRPALEDGRFTARYVESEKTTVQKRLEAVINDKIRYAAQRCLEEMFAGDPYRLNALGAIGDLPAITPETLHNRYRQWLADAQLDLYVAGDVTPEAVFGLVAETFAAVRRAPAPYRLGEPPKPKPEAKRVEEALDVSQGKLNIGLALPVLASDDDYPAALVYNGILGGFPHSKLFVNVREKASLAYYASSRYDGWKGYAMIQSGIDVRNRDKALSIIEEQLAELAGGRITDAELAQTKALIVSQLNELSDSAFDMIAFDFNGVLTGRGRSPQQLAEAVLNVAPDDVVRVARLARMDTVYFLRDRQGGTGE
jgi:predicted Zn-dependent peptidase